MYISVIPSENIAHDMTPLGHCPVSNSWKVLRTAVSIQSQACHCGGCAQAYINLIPFLNLIFFLPAFVFPLSQASLITIVFSCIFTEARRFPRQINMSPSYRSYIACFLCVLLLFCVHSIDRNVMVGDPEGMS